jgi:hypothetical protein
MFRELKGTRMQIGGQEQLQTNDDSGKNKKTTTTIPKPRTEKHPSPRHY